MTSRFQRLLLAGSVSIAAIGSASAGGFDRGGVNIDQLFDSARFSAEAGVTYVSPQRKIKNVRRLDGSGAVTPEIDVDGDYTVPRAGFKANLFEPIDCLGTYTEPYGVDAKYGANNAHSPTSTEFSIDTKDYSLTCSYKFDVGRGQARIIGGVSYQEVDAFLARQTLQTFVIPLPPPLGGVRKNPGIGTFELSDSAFSWRIGTAYEIPEIAFRASVMYSARYNYDNLTGTVDTRGFAVGPTNPALPIPGAPPPGAFLGVNPVTASAEIPQAIELKLQSGIAPGWVAFGSFKWQDWSKLGVIPINGVRNPVTGAVSKVSFDPLYRDGYTVTGGIGHKFTDMISGAATVTWDRGTSTIIGTQTDTWTFGLGGSFTPNENVEVRLGGLLGVLTSGESRPSGGDPANNLTYEFDNDLVAAATGSIKIKF